MTGSDHYDVPNVVEQYATTNAAENLPPVFFEYRNRFVHALSGKTVLDAGCGPGRDTDYFASIGLDAHGVDAAPAMIAQARAAGRNDPHYLCADFRNMPYPDDHFDGIWAATSIFLLTPGEMPDALNEWNRVMAHEGVLYAGFKLGDGVIEKDEFGSTVEQYRISDQEARELITEAGFSIAFANVTRTAHEAILGNYYAVNGTFDELDLGRFPPKIR